QQEDRHEDEHRDEAAQQELAEGDGPQIDEDDLDVERDEQQGIDVERQAEPGVRVAVGVDAALVRKAFVKVAPVPVRNEPCRTDRQEDERHPREGEPDDVPDGGQALLTPGAARRARRHPPDRWPRPWKEGMTSAYASARTNILPARRFCDTNGRGRRDARQASSG